MPDTLCVEKRKLGCDDVSVLMGILERLQKTPVLGYGSKMREALQLAALLEIMDTLGCEFENNDAAGNALSRFDEFNELRGMD